MTFAELLSLVQSESHPRVCLDSRQVTPGDVFVAVKGQNLDGRDFISHALANGAKFIICHSTYLAPTPAVGVITIPVPDTSIAAATLAQAAKGNPASKLTNLAVTGTNGKTTVAFLVRCCIQAAGEKCGLIGTVIYDTGQGICEAPLTTPDCLTIAEKQAEMLKAGAKFMVIEASSHALDQNRLAAIDFKAAAFTNLTGDHLDYHKTKENYLDAKAKLFERLSPSAAAILNKQSPESKQIARRTKAKIIWYAIDAQADITAQIESMDVGGAIYALGYAGQKRKVKTPLLGRHNVANHLAAAGLCLAAGLDLKTIAQGLSALEVVPGRLENVKPDAPFTVLVDYAHTDDALFNVLTTLRPLCKRKLIVVFGCGGDRDKTKRPRMAKVAENLADLVIVTSDNPRTENPNNIIEQIVAGFEKGPAVQSCEIRNTHDARRTAKIVEPDRRKAIELAIAMAEKDDTILIAGKGHENYQIIGKQKFPFSDKQIALDLLLNRR